MATKKQKAHRANGEGSISQRASDGRWWARISLTGGRRKAVYGKDRAEVHKKLTELLAAQHRGLPVVSNRETLGGYIAQWLESAHLRMRYTTWRRRRYHLQHLTAALGTVRLAALQPRQVAACYARFLADGAAVATVRQMGGVLHLVLRDALREGLVARNVTELVDLPRATEPHHSILDGVQLATLRAAAVEERHWGALWLLMALHGPRLGECLALHWRDLSLTATYPVAKIEGNLAHAERQEGGDVRIVWAVGPTKTRAGRRTIRLHPDVVDALRRHHVQQKAQRLAAGAAWVESDLVFPDRSGEPKNASTLRGVFQRFLRRNGLPPIRLHDLRHTAASWMLGHNVPVTVVAEVLGHASPAMTMKVYAHALPTGQEQALSVWDQPPATASGR
jgi:integrase